MPPLIEGAPPAFAVPDRRQRPDPAERLRVDNRLGVHQRRGRPDRLRARLPRRHGGRRHGPDQLSGRRPDPPDRHDRARPDRRGPVQLPAADQRRRDQRPGPFRERRRRRDHRRLLLDRRRPELPRARSDRPGERRDPEHIRRGGDPPAHGGAGLGRDPADRAAVEQRGEPRPPGDRRPADRGDDLRCGGARWVRSAPRAQRPTSPPRKQSAAAIPRGGRCPSRNLGADQSSTSMSARDLPVASIARAAAMNLSSAPSSTPPVSEVSTPVRRSLTI